MEAINSNIKIQYETGRIKGPEYANVYLGSMQTAVSEAFKYLLQKQLIEKDLELKDAQIESVSIENTIKQEQSIKDLEVKTAQISKINDDLLTSVKQRESISKDLELKQVQIEATESDILIKQEQNTKDLDIKYVQQVKLDKETATLGLDDVIKMKETSRDGNSVYQVSYVR